MRANKRQTGEKNRMASSPGPRPAPECPPPRAPGRRPRLKLPPGACDSHFHAIGPWEQFPFDPQRRFTPNDSTKEQIFALHKHLGIERGVAVQSSSTYGTDNRVLLDLIAAGEGRYRGVGVIDQPFDDRVLRQLHDGGVRGVRYYNLEHLRELQSSDFRRRVADAIRPMGWHMVFLGDVTKREVMQELLSFGLPLVLDHMGRHAWRPDDPRGVHQDSFKTLLSLQRNERMWVKIGCADRSSLKGAPFADINPYARAIIEAAPDRVIWGTDYPHNHQENMPDDADLVDFIGDIAPEPEMLQRLMVDNPTRLYWSN
jgi:2-pyrone-4,6-dicarboxylate lactonase